MHVCVHLRSSAALVVVLALFASTAVPPALCDSDGQRARCAMDAARPMASHACCDEPERPPARLSCCCHPDEAALPAGTAAATALADASATVLVSVVQAVVPTRAGPNQAPVTTVHRIHATALFTLFAAFLI